MFYNLMVHKKETILTKEENEEEKISMKFAYDKDSESFKRGIKMFDTKMFFKKELVRILCEFIRDNSSKNKSIIRMNI